MDDRQAARRQHIEPPHESENTSDLLKSRSNPAKGEADAGGGRSGAARAGRDPEATERFGDASREPTERPGRADRVDKSGDDAPVAAFPAGRARLEISDDSAPNDLPELVTDNDRLVVGSELCGRYLILDEPEESSMALVYRALDRQRKHAGDSYPYVAVKAARAGDEDGDSMAAHLRQEFLKLSRLHHPNIVAAYDLSADRGIEFMVLEWLGGETLATVLEELTSKRLALRTARDIITAVASALAHAHEAGIVHGDVKPSNVFITGQQQVKLIDFGATVPAPADADQSHKQSWATRAYASADVLNGRPPRPSDDVYALGVTAYRLLSGERPFGDYDALEARENGLVPEALPEDASVHWAAVRSALQFDRVDRPKNAAEFLERFFDETYVPPEPPSAVPAFSDLARVEWGALATIAWGLLIWWLVADGPEPPAAGNAYLSGAVVAATADDTADRNSAVNSSDAGIAAYRAGLDDPAAVYLAQARTALEGGDFVGAISNLDSARQVQPDHFGIPAIEDLVARYRRDLLVSARSLADSDTELAGQYLKRAADLSDADDPAIASAREELQQQRASAQVADLIRRIDQRILSERLLVPTGDSAMDLVSRAIAVAPDSREVRLAENRIASALLFQAMFSISNGDLDDAKEFIDAARSLDVEHLAMARAEYELAKARSALVRRNAGTSEAQQ